MIFFQQSNITVPFMQPQWRRAMSSGGVNPIRANLVLELIADNIPGTDGDLVATWPDTSGLGNDAAQATSAARPALKAAILNGHAVARFDGVDDYMEGAAVDYAKAPATDITWFVVGKRRSGDSIVGYAYLPICWPEAAPNGTLGAGWAANGAFAARLSQGGAITGALPTGKESGFLCLSVQKSDTHYIVAVDGEVIADGEAPSGLGTNKDIYRLCAGYGTSDGIAAYDIAELLAYSSALSDADRKVVEDYLGAKYGITITH